MGKGVEIIHGQLYQCSKDCFWINHYHASRGAISPSEYLDEMTGWDTELTIEKISVSSGMESSVQCYFPTFNGIGGKDGHCFLDMGNDD